MNKYFFITLLMVITLLESCISLQLSNKDLVKLSNEHYVVTGLGLEEIRKEIAENFSWHNIDSHSKNFRGLICLQFILDNKGNIDSIKVLNKIEDTSIKDEVTRCVRKIKISFLKKIPNNTTIEVNLCIDLHHCITSSFH